ncbi:MAG: hypothetical protein OEW05_12630 [Candidatus Aminicenantes bacterium]|nr:hypothetical protein [Candidatus Aminicenantes bacterium]
MMNQTPVDAVEKRKSAYYREVAKAFLDRRGAPFLLSARDLALIAEWEKRGIPLEVVLEGVERAFEGGRAGRHPSGKVMSLAFCGPQVEKAFDRHRDRRAGAEGRVKPRSAKKDRAAAEVNQFLASLPRETAELRPLFVRAASVLAAEVPDEEALERVDAEVDDALVLAVSEDEKDARARRLRDEHPGRRKAERETILAAALAKERRERFKVPYVALFHY